MDNTTLNLIPAAGDRFGRWTVLDQPSFCIQKKRQIPCRCDCGTVKTVYSYHLRKGHSRHCGCLRFKHGAACSKKKTPEFTAWKAMRGRCQNPSNRAYARYGGRGITVCPEWEDFAVFFRDMGLRPSSEYSLDRIDNNQGYCALNCRWATRLQQCNNQNRNLRLEFNGRCLAVAEWAREIGITRPTLKARLKRGWSVERSLTEPKH